MAFFSREQARHLDTYAVLDHVSSKEDPVSLSNTSCNHRIFLSFFSNARPLELQLSSACLSRAFGFATVQIGCVSRPDFRRPLPRK